MPAERTARLRSTDRQVSTRDQAEGGGLLPPSR